MNNIQLTKRLEEDLEIVSFIYHTMLPAKPVNCSESYLRVWCIEKTLSLNEAERQSHLSKIKLLKENQNEEQ